MCSTFKKYGVCPLGFNCPKKHNYENQEVNICVAFNVLIGGNAKIVEEISKISKNLEKINQKIDDSKISGKDISMILNKIKSIDEKMENISDAAKSGGLPLKSYYAVIQDSTATFPNLPSVHGHKLNPTLNQRAVSSNKNACVGVEILRSDTSSSEKDDSGKGQLSPDDIESNVFLLKCTDENYRDFIEKMSLDKTPTNSPRNSYHQTSSNDATPKKNIIAKSRLNVSTSKDDTEITNSSKGLNFLETLKDLRSSLENLSNQKSLLLDLVKTRKQRSRSSSNERSSV